MLENKLVKSSYLGILAMVFCLCAIAAAMETLPEEVAKPLTVPVLFMAMIIIGFEIIRYRK